MIMANEDKSEVGLAPEAKKAIKDVSAKFREAMGMNKPAESAPMDENPEGAETEFKKVDPKELEGAPEIVPAPKPFAKEEPKPKAEERPKEAPGDSPGRAEEPKEGTSSAENFRRLRTKAEGLERKAAELEAQLSKAREGSAKYADIEAKLAEAERKAAEAAGKVAELGVYQRMYELETSEEFGQHYQRQMDEALIDAKDAAPDLANDIEMIFKSPPGQWRESRVREVVNNLEDDYSRNAFISAYSKLKSVQRERSAEMEKSRVDVNHKKLQEMRAARTAEEQRRADLIRQNFWRTTEAELDEELGDDPEKDAIKTTLRDVITGKVSAEEYSGVLRAAARAKKMSNVIAQRDEEISMLKSQLAELQGSSPRMGREASAKPSQGHKGLSDPKQLGKELADKMRAAVGWK